jgi:predicted RNA-binding protein
MGMIAILEMEDVIYSSVEKDKIQLQTLMKKKVT